MTMQISTKYRFIPKRYGRGFVPISWEGRVCTLCLLALVFGSAYAHGLFSDIEPTMQQMVGYLVELVIIIFASLRFMDSKTDGALKWRWGSEN